MKMNMFCEDIAKSLDEDTRMATMRTFCNWNEKWHHPTRYTIDYQKCVLCARLMDRHCLSMAWIVSLHLMSRIDGLIKSKDIKTFLAKLSSLKLRVYYLHDEKVQGTND